MDWHIITSSKGGTGKTLLTLLLLAHHLEKNQGTTLVVDLNGMNADTSAILLYERRSRRVPVRLDTQVLIPQDAEQIIIQKSFSLDSNKRPHYYLVGRPLNPFGLYNPTLFTDLLRTIKVSAEQIIEELELRSPLQHVIIDSNYHFCNLFSQDKNNKDYEPYTIGELKDDSITVWFMWVYRQLEKLLSGDDATLVKLTATAIEHNLNRHLDHGNNTTPFMHVFNPVALLSAQPGKNKEGRMTATISAFRDAWTHKKDFTVKELEQLEQLPTRIGICFDKWIEQLEIARVAVGQRSNDDPYFLFLDILVEAVKALNPESPLERPLNVMPLSVYQHALQYYTDKDRRDAVAIFKNMKIYKRFSKLYDSI